MQLNIRLGCAIGCIGLCTLGPHDAFAWGQLGHRITGAVAESLLTASARRQVSTLLGTESLATAATYMDTQRPLLSQRWPAADQWHYDNLPVCGHPKAAYPSGNCATHKIAEFRTVLADRSAGKDERATALRLLIHLVGDLHQPLHMADNADRGGNDLYVKLAADGEPWRLHEVFDTVLVRELAGQQRARDYARQLQNQYREQLVAWQRGTVDDWARQSHELAVTHVYGDLPGFACHAAYGTITLSGAYLQNARQYLPEQLTKAGARIAAVLNATLK